MATPTNRMSVPKPSAERRVVVVRLPAKIPYTSSRIPSARVTTDMTGPQRDSFEAGRLAPSRTAAIGGTRVALIAGLRLASSVTKTPTTRLTTIVRVANTVSPLGNSTPSAEKSAWRPFAIARPKKRPSSDAITPTTSASSITLRST
jgi:hypothetical protein